MQRAEQGVDFDQTRVALAALVHEFVLARDYQKLTEQTSEQDVHHWVDRLLQALGWNVDAPGEYSRQRYCRGAGVADAVLMRAGVPVMYIEVKRLGGIPPLRLLRQDRVYYTPEEEQALRYARRSIDLPEGQRWTILTNFNQLYLFEATTEERVMVFESAEELVDRFEDDTRYLTKGEVLASGLARWTQRRERPDVDEEFRERLNLWRLALAQDMHDRNEEGILKLDEGGVDLNKLQRAVQRLLDRLIILQYATDLEAVAGEPLRELLERTQASSSVLVRQLSLREELNATFARFDNFYNTSIFAPGHICEEVDIGDEVLREIVAEVASQNFRRFSSDILGATYETYLGQVLEVDEAGQVKLVTRPEVRRAEGVYYTPTHVVRYIVDQVLDPFLRDASLESVSDLTILDPACGSGSFLVAAYEKLADWYENFNRSQLEAAGLPSDPEQQALLDESGTPSVAMVDYARRILEYHLYGVDLDPDAAELAAINLIMTAIRRGMRGRSLEKLPAILGQNIKVGNSLIPGIQALPGFALAEALEGRANELQLLSGRRRRLQVEDDVAKERELIVGLESTTQSLATPVTQQLPADGIDPEEHRAFAWPVEFPEVFDTNRPVEERGFHCVIGNPPWIGFHGAREVRPYLGRRYVTCRGRFDMYVPFIELGVRLLRFEGRFGMITPSNFFLRDYGQKLRRFLREESALETVVDFGDVQIFPGATNYPAILIARRNTATPDNNLDYLLKTYDHDSATSYKQSELSDEPWLFVTEAERHVFSKMEASPSRSLSEVCVANGIVEGIVTGQNKVFLLSEDEVAKLELDEQIIRKCPRGQFIKRWALMPGAEFIIYPYDIDASGRTVPWEESRIKGEYPKLYDYLTWQRAIPSKEGGLSGREYFDSSSKNWFELWNQRDKSLLDRPKILTPEVAATPNFAVVRGDTYVADSGTAVVLPDRAEDLYYLTGLLNSRVLGRYHQRRSVPKANGYLIFKHAFLKRLPIRFPEADQSFLYDKIVRLAKSNSDRAAERVEADLDFTRYLQEFSLDPKRDVGSWLRPILPRDIEVLSTRRGKLLKAEVELDGTSLLVIGKVRLENVEYEGTGGDVEPIVRVKLDEPRMSFLRYYLPWAHVAKAFSTSTRLNLYQKLLKQPLPRMNDDEVAAAVERYEPVFNRFLGLTQEIMEADREIDEAVAALYGLDEADLAVLELGSAE